MPEDDKRFPPPPTSERPKQVVRSRFSVIIEEMTIEESVGEYKPETGSFDNIISGDMLLCQRCGLSAFTPITIGLDKTPAVNCRACPLPAPIYRLSPDIRINADTYRCFSCGKRSDVALPAALNEVNLYCGGCGRLALHTLQRQPTPVLTQSGSALVTAAKVRGDTPQWIDDLYKDAEPVQFDDDKPQPLNEMKVEFVDIKWWENVVNDFTQKLGFEDFEKFYARRQEENIIKRKLKKIDWERQTGRTTRGLVEVLAWCLVKQSDLLVIRAHNPTYERDLVRRADTMRRTLKIAYPRRILPNGPNRRDVITPKALVYIDHYVYEDNDTKIRL